jgi:hypothetical protein
MGGDKRKSDIWKSWYNWSDEFLTPADIEESEVHM